MAAGFYRFPALGASKANDLTDAHISPGASGSSVELTARPAAPPESNPQLTGIPSAHSPAQAASAQSSPLFLKVEEQDGAVSVRAWGMCQGRTGASKPFVSPIANFEAAQFTAGVRRAAVVEKTTVVAGVL